MVDTAPSIPLDKFPEVERRYIFFINMLLSDLDLRCRELHAAIALFDMADKEIRRMHVLQEYSELNSQWIFMSVREASSAIYKFEEDMSMLGTNINKCPTLLNMIDTDAKREVTRQFKQSFPNIKPVRDSCQHGGIIFGSPEKLEDHAAGKLFQTNNIINYTYQTIHKKKRVHLEVAAPTLAELKEVRDLYWAVFWPLVIKLRTISP